MLGNGMDLASLGDGGTFFVSFPFCIRARALSPQIVNIQNITKLNLKLNLLSAFSHLFRFRK